MPSTRATARRSGHRSNTSTSANGAKSSRNAAFSATPTDIAATDSSAQGSALQRRYMNALPKAASVTQARNSSVWTG